MHGMGQMNPQQMAMMQRMRMQHQGMMRAGEPLPNMMQNGGGMEMMGGPGPGMMMRQGMGPGPGQMQMGGMQRGQMMQGPGGPQEWPNPALGMA